MGVLPLEYLPGQTRESLGLSGHEEFAVAIDDGVQPRQKLTVTASDPATGASKTFEAQCRIDTPVEVDYYRNGGILQTVLRKLLAPAKAAPAAKKAAAKKKKPVAKKPAVKKRAVKKPAAKKAPKSLTKAAAKKPVAKNVAKPLAKKPAKATAKKPAKPVAKAKQMGKLAGKVAVAKKPAKAAAKPAGKGKAGGRSR
jgi:hypothetical protein